jgi:threonine dehydratase
VLDQGHRLRCDHDWIAHADEPVSRIEVGGSDVDVELVKLGCGAQLVISVPYAEWREAMRCGWFRDIEGHFVHPVRDYGVMAGNGTIGLELVEQLDEIHTVLVPWGGGGLAAGIASALAAISPKTQVFACEPETLTPASGALAAGHPVEVPYQPSFVDALGTQMVLPEVWEVAQPLLAGAVVVTLADVAAAVRLLAERVHVVAEGAGAISLAAALGGAVGGGRVACIVSGGNIDPASLAAILAGSMPPVKC